MTDLLKTIQTLMMDPNAMTRLFAIDLLIQNHHRLEPDTVVELLQAATNDREDEVVRHAKLSMSKLLEWGFGAEDRLRELGIHSRMTTLSDIERGREQELRRAAHEVLTPVLSAARQLVPNHPLAPQALVTLGLLQDAGSINLLIDSLGNPVLRDKAFEALEHFRTPEVLALVNRLVERERDDAMLSKSADVLGGLEDAEALGTLAKLAAASSETVRERAALALGKLPRRAGEPALVTMWERETAAAVQLAILASLGRVGREAAVDAIGRRIGSIGDDRVLSKAMMTLGQIGLGKAFPILSKALPSPHLRVRANALEGIARLPVSDKELLPLVEPYLSDKNNRVRGNALMAVFPHDHKRALDELRRMMKSDKPLDRATAAWIAAEIQNVEAVEALVVMTNTELDKTVLATCMAAISRLRNPRVRAVLQKLLAHPNPQVRVQAVGAYARVGGPPVLRELENLYQQTDHELVRSTIVTAMGVISHQGNLTFLQRKLGDSSERVVANAIEALDNVAGLEVSVMVQPFTGHANPRIRANAIVVLWNLGHLQEAAGLARLLSARDEAGPRAALYALGTIARNLSWREIEKRALLHSALADRVKALPPPKDDLNVTIGFVPPKLEARDETADAELVLVEALRAMTEMREDVARETVKRLLERDPTSPHAHFLMARLSAGQPQRHDPPAEVADKGKFLYLLCEQLKGAKASGDVESVLSGYFSIFSLHLEILARFVEHGRQFLGKGDQGGAGAIARFIVSQLQWTEDLHRRLGMVHLAQKDYAGAEGELWKACLNTPDEPGAILELARASAGLGKRKLARALTAMLLANESLDPRIRAKVAEFERRLGDGKA
ncbi:MAG: HEAT repeat domain-containing protein [Candidatus Wallbacteria bacterium]|nr:HEAT repeat domain-containing protein [Candidatus Wallbacteria bacterium]